MVYIVLQLILIEGGVYQENVSNASMGVRVTNRILYLTLDGL